MTILLVLAVPSTMLLLTAAVFLMISPQLGAAGSPEDVERYQKSPQFRDGKFQNIEKTAVTTSFSMRTFGYFWGANKVPDWLIPVEHRDADSFAHDNGSSPRITWFGHSAVLIEIDSKKLFLDPMLSSVTVPHSIVGSRRFNDTLPLPIEQLPPLDAVIISHDHYDHLDYRSIVLLNSRVKKFFVPLGVGAHLLSWGVAQEKITELDWWDTVDFDGVTLVSTPARHFSGRGLLNSFSTLWCSWVIKGKNLSLFFGGDSGYDHSFKKIGEAYGPFDLTMLECGQYDEQWPQIHMMPEETVQADIDLRGTLLLPIHWGSFKIALHPWNEPVARLLKEALKLNMNVTTPIIGESIILGASAPSSHWWKR